MAIYNLGPKEMTRFFELASGSDTFRPRYEELKKKLDILRSSVADKT